MTCEGTPENWVRTFSRAYLSHVNNAAGDSLLRVWHRFFIRKRFGCFFICCCFHLCICYVHRKHRQSPFSFTVNHAGDLLLCSHIDYFWLSADFVLGGPRGESVHKLISEVQCLSESSYNNVRCFAANNICQRSDGFVTMKYLFDTFGPEPTKRTEIRLFSWKPLSGVLPRAQTVTCPSKCLWFNLKPTVLLQLQPPLKQPTPHSHFYRFNSIACSCMDN